MEKSDRLLARIKMAGSGKNGYIDKAGKVVIEPRFDVVGEFSEGLAVVSIGGKWGYIDKTGKYVWEQTE
jgi:hypothetical protein